MTAFLNYWHKALIWQSRLAQSIDVAIEVRRSLEMGNVPQEGRRQSRRDAQDDFPFGTMWPLSVIKHNLVLLYPKANPASRLAAPGSGKASKFACPKETRLLHPPNVNPVL